MKSALVLPWRRPSKTLFSAFLSAVQSRRDFLSLTFPFPLFACFQNCNVTSIYFSFRFRSLLLSPSPSPFLPHESFPDIKAAVVSPQRSHKSDKWKATRLLSACVNVNNYDGSATREQEADSEWGTSRELGRRTGWDASPLVVCN